MKTQVRLTLALSLAAVLYPAFGSAATTNAADAPRAQVRPVSQAALLPVSVAIGTATLPAAQDPEQDSQDPGEELDRWHGPVVRVGQDYTLASGEVAGEVRTILGDATLEGHVRRDVFVILGTARVKASAVVDGGLVVIGGSAIIDPGATVSRELVVVGGALDAPAGFTPGGDLVAIGTPTLGNALHALVPWLTRGLLWGRPLVPDLAWVWAVFGALLLVYLLVNTLFDGPVGASADVLLERPVSVFFLGLLVLLLIVPVITILAATVIGLVIVPFVLCAIVAGALVGKAGVCRAIGRAFFGSWLEGSKLGALAAFALGAVILGVAYLVPILGLVMWAVTTVLALGAATVAIRRRLRFEQRSRRATARPETPAPAGPGSGFAEAGAPGAALADWEGERAPGTPPPIESASAAPPPAYAQSAAEPPLNGSPDVEPPASATVPPVPPPRPSPAPVPGGLYPTATFLDRVAAFALDALLVAVFLQLALDSSRDDGIFPLALLAYHIGFWAWKGTTLGGIIVGLRVVRTQGQGLRFVDALVRGLSAVFSIGAFGIGCFWMIQDPARQMWHDKIAGTQVLKMPREMVLQENWN